MSHFSKEALAGFYELWDANKDKIAQLYEEKQPSAVEKLTEAIVQYEKLLAYGGVENHPQHGQEQPVLLPLNGVERLAFIKKHIQSHYAFVQLEALYDETRKKAARLAITTRK